MPSNIYAYFPPFENLPKKDYYQGKEAISFVVGFLFDDEGKVALIRKEKPAWQKGHLNGIGGKIEPGEEPLKAMRREFLEETGAGVLEWRLFRILRLNTGGSIYFYVAHGKRDIQTTTEEKVGWYNVANLNKLKTIANLRRYIPEAQKKDMNDIGVQIERMD